MRAAFAQAHDPHEWKRALTLPACGMCEFRVILRSIWGIEDGSVDGHHPPGPKPRSACSWSGHRDGDPTEQFLQWCGTQSSPGLREGTAGRHLPCLFPILQEPQATNQPAHHFLVGFAEE